MKVTEILNELRMSPKAFQTTLAQQGDKVLVGYEVECVIPLNQFDISEQRNSLHVSDIKSYNVLDHYFSVGFSSRRRFEQLYDEYVARRRQEEKDKFLDANAEEYDNGEDLEQAADDYLDDEYEDPTEDEFIENEFGDYASVISEFDWEPDYDWVPGREGEWFFSEPSEHYSTNDAIYDEMKKSLQKYIGPELLDIINDSSIEHDDEEIGTEIITKPLPLNKALPTLSKIFTWLSHMGGSTNDTTGLHINISIEGKPAVDWLKLGLFLGEKHVLETFDRLSNVYTQQQLKRLASDLRLLEPRQASFIRGYHQKYTSIENVITKLNELISRGKYSTYNISKYEAHGYVEFRMPGGQNYERDFEKIKNTTLRFVRAMVVAADPQAYKQEYYKKITQYIQRALNYSSDTNQETAASKDEAHGLDAHLNIFIDLIRRTVQPHYKGFYEEMLRLYKSALTDKNQHEITEARTNFLMLYKNIVKYVRTYGVNLSTEQKTSLMMIAKRLGISRNELQTVVSTVGSADRQY